MSKLKIHFGHPIGTYGTAIESKLINIIVKSFPEFELDNCNQPHHQKAAKKFEKKTGETMGYFFKIFIPKMSVGVFLPYRDGMFGAGVYDEAFQMFQEGKQVFEIDYKGKISTMQPDYSRRLSIPETRKRNNNLQPKHS